MRLYFVVLFVSLPIVKSTSSSNQNKIMNEIQVTHGAYGHTLNASQVFSPDGKWIVYDTRNDDTHISRTNAIEKVHVETGEIVRLYTTQGQTVYGPGVGAAAFHPLKEKIIYIHGLLNCTQKFPYGFTRRFGAITNTSQPKGFIHAEARKIAAPLVPGALRGGTHAHTWSGDGTSISFTYNDALMEQLEKQTKGLVKDMRTIGVMTEGHPVKTGVEGDEEFPGSYFAVITATVTEKPLPGSDAIDRAFDECWIGTNGYIRKDGNDQKKALAFQGNVRDKNDHTVTEVFVSDIPEDITIPPSGLKLEGKPETHPNVPDGLTQTRLTHTTGRRYPGIQGPRCRLRSSPDGRSIYFHMKDDGGIVQIYSVPSTGGLPEQITAFENSIEGQYNVSPDGKMLSCIADNKIWIVDIEKKTMQSLTGKSETKIAGGALWSKDGKLLVYNRYVASGTEKYLQIFKIAGPGS